MREKDLREKLDSVAEMLNKGIVITFINPETFTAIKDKLSQIDIHKNLKFMEVDKVERGTIVFAEQPKFDAFLSPLFTEL